MPNDTNIQYVAEKLHEEIGETATVLILVSDSKGCRVGKVCDDVRDLALMHILTGAMVMEQLSERDEK